MYVCSRRVARGGAGLFTHFEIILNAVEFNVGIFEKLKVPGTV